MIYISNWEISVSFALKYYSGMGFCTLTPGESSIAYKLLSKSENKFNVASDETMIIGQHQQLFDSDYLPEDSVYQNEAHIEFSLLADIDPIKHLFPKVIISYVGRCLYPFQASKYGQS
jgi:hypothetical protein